MAFLRAQHGHGVHARPGLAASPAAGLGIEAMPARQPGADERLDCVPCPRATATEWKSSRERPGQRMIVRQAIGQASCLLALHAGQASGDSAGRASRPSRSATSRRGRPDPLAGPASRRTARWRMSRRCAGPGRRSCAGTRSRPRDDSESARRPAVVPRARGRRPTSREPARAFRTAPACGSPRLRAVPAALADRALDALAPGRIVGVPVAHVLAMSSLRPLAFGVLAFPCALTATLAEPLGPVRAAVNRTCPLRRSGLLCQGCPAIRIGQDTGQATGPPTRRPGQQRPIVDAAPNSTMRTVPSPKPTQPSWTSRLCRPVRHTRIRPPCTC